MAEYKPILLALPSLTPSLAVEVLPHGVTIHRIYVQADGRTHDILVGPESPQDHSVVKYHSTIIGRYANRVPVGTHTIEKNGITSQFTAITNESPKVSLHGGPSGFDQYVWTQLSSLSQATLFTPAELKTLVKEADGESSSAIFRAISEDGDQGYPGKLLLEVLVTLIPSYGEINVTGGAQRLGSVVIVYRAKLEDAPDGKKTVTPINLTQHWGFNLDASLKRGKTLSILDHKVKMKASHVAELQSNFLPTGNYIPVADAGNSSGVHVLDDKRIGDGFTNPGYDDYYLLSPRPSSSIAPHRIPVSSFEPTLDLLKDILLPRENESLLVLSSDKSGLSVEFDSNQAGFMFYTYNFADPQGYRKKIHGGTGVKGDGYPPQSGVFIEFHEPLSAFLYPTTTSTDTLLTSGEIYNNFVRADVILEHAGLPDPDDI